MDCIKNELQKFKREGQILSINKRRDEVLRLRQELYPDDSKSWKNELQLSSQELVLEFAQLKMALKNK